MHDQISVVRAVRFISHIMIHILTHINILQLGNGIVAKFKTARKSPIFTT